MNETLEQMAQAIFKDWFVDFGPVRRKQEGASDPIAIMGGLVQDAARAAELAALFPEGFGDDGLPAGWTKQPLHTVFEIKELMKKGTIAPYSDMASLPTSGPTANSPVMREFGSGMRFRNGDALLARITPCLENCKATYVDFLDEGVIGWGSTEFIVLRARPKIPEPLGYLLVRQDDFRSHAIRSMTGTSGRQRAQETVIGDYQITVTDFLKLIRDFTVFGDKGEGPFKIIAGYHQFHGAQKAIHEAIAASQPDGDRKIGVIWHTQGSGKSYLMAFFAGLAVRAQELANPTLVVLTDRNDLDDQLFGTFSLCRDLIRQTPEQATSRDDLKRLLERSAGGVIFTTLQKFSPAPGEEDFPLLTDRRNVIVVADEAHRSQYGFDARLDPKTGKRRYGYAHCLRRALPGASFIGFTGTPVEGDDRNTPAIFGDYIDVYDISRAVEDRATVPIYYESRVARIVLNEDEKPKIDAEIEEMLEDETLTEAEKFKAKWSTVEALVGSDKRIEQIAADLVAHLEARLDALQGKAMAVCMSRRICVKLYDAIIALHFRAGADQ